MRPARCRVCVDATYSNLLRFSRRQLRRGGQTGRDGSWCSGLAVGTYSLSAVGVPVGYRSTIDCAALIEDLEATELNTSSDSFTISAEFPLWECSIPFVFAPLSFELFIEGGFGRDLNWFDRLAPVVTDENDNDVSESCVVVEASTGDGFANYDCPGLGTGTYSVAVSNAPEPFTTDNTCGAIEVRDDQSFEQSRCTISFSAEDVFEDDETMVDPPGPGEAEPDPVPTPTGQLPETGIGCDLLALIGAGLLIAGLALLGVGGRRRPPSFRV